jgi:hypothetical protein
LEDRLFL